MTEIIINIDITTLHLLSHLNILDTKEEPDSPWVNVLSHTVSLRIMGAWRLSQGREVNVSLGEFSIEGHTWKSCFSNP